MTAVTALLGFVAWTLLLIFVVFIWRFLEVLRGRPANSWGRGNAIASPGIVTRIEHAHLNCLENLPVFGVIVLAASAMGKIGAIEAVAPFVLYARLGQSITHLIGVTHWLVFIRANFYAIQLLLFFYMLWRLIA